LNCIEVECKFATWNIEVLQNSFVGLSPFRSYKACQKDYCNNPTLNLTQKKKKKKKKSSNPHHIDIMYHKTISFYALNSIAMTTKAMRVFATLTVIW
jgi:hypothetical protein